MLAEVHVGELVAEVAVDGVLLGLDGAAEGLVVAAAERLGFDLQVHLEMDEEVDVLAEIEGEHGANSAHSGAEENDFTCAGGQLALLYCSADLAEEELIDLLHFEGCAIQVTVLPLELGRRWVVFGVFLAAGWKSVDEEVFKFVHPSQGIFVEHAEIGQPSVQNVVSKYVELPLFRFEFQYVHRLLLITCINPALLAAYLDYGRLEVPVVILTKQLLLPHLVNSKDAAHATDNPTADFVESRRNLLTGGLVDQLDGATISRDSIGLYPSSLAASLESSVNTDSKEQIRLAWITNALRNIK